MVVAGKLRSEAENRMETEKAIVYGLVPNSWLAGGDFFVVVD